MHTYTYSEKGYQIITHVRKYTCMLMLAFVLKCVNVYYLSQLSVIILRDGVRRKVPMSTRPQIFLMNIYENPKSIKHFLELLFKHKP